MTKVKHITMHCPTKYCYAKAFVQALLVDDPDTQKKIDAKAIGKLTAELDQQHKDGLHD